jgi:hypothetical protein
VVLEALGLSSGAYSFPYVARWSEGFNEIVKDTAERVIGCAKDILTSMEVEAVDYVAHDEPASASGR